MGKPVLDLNKKTTFFNFSTFLAFLKIKEYIPPCRRLQNFTKNWLILGYQ